MHLVARCVQVQTPPEEVLAYSVPPLRTPLAPGIPVLLTSVRVFVPERPRPQLLRHPLLLVVALVVDPPVMKFRTRREVVDTFEGSQGMFEGNVQRGCCGIGGEIGFRLKDRH